MQEKKGLLTAEKRKYTIAYSDGPAYWTLVDRCKRNCPSL